MVLEKTEYYDNFLDYYAKAARLQKEGNLGGKPYDQIDIKDDLMQKVTIYDTVHRCHAGFSNVLQDIWHGSKAPKYYKRDAERRKINDHFNSWRLHFNLETWLYIFIVHRITGSGASFEADHGYRNSIVRQMCLEAVNLEQMAQFIAGYQGTLFTSIGNQIPPFNKTTTPGWLAGKDYLVNYVPKLVTALADFLQKGPKKTIKETIDFMVDWNTTNGLKRYKFQYSAVGADCADYFPSLVLQRSPFYRGKNAQEALSLMFIKPKKMAQEKFLEEALGYCADAVGGYEYDVEDACCDSIRWVENYIPLHRQGTYDHLCLDSVWSSSKIFYHPKGRQKTMLLMGLVKTFNGRKSFGDHTILEEVGMSTQTYKENVKMFYLKGHGGLK